MTEFIKPIISFIYEQRYIFVFLAALFEGTNIMLLAGFLYRLGVFKFWNTFFLLLMGYFLNGYIWYCIGYFGGRKFLNKWGSRFLLTKERLIKLENYFKKHTTKALIITRITYGISSYVLILAGIFKTKAKKFFWCNLIASIIWVLGMFFIGYSFGASYTLVGKITRTVTIWLTVVTFILMILSAIALVLWLRKLARRKFLEKILNHNYWSALKKISNKFYKFLDDNI